MPIAATDLRTLPISAQHREFSIRVDGELLPRVHQLVGLTLQAQADRIASARLVFLDGAASRSEFTLSSAPTFAPGARVEVAAGAGRDVQTLFVGQVVSHAIKLRDRVAPQLVVECRHAASRLAQVRRGRHFADQLDSEVIEHLLGAAEVPLEVQATSLKHEQLVQFDTSDWDFCLRRAQSMGLTIFTRAGKMSVRAPALDGATVATLTFGATLIELDAEADARHQAESHHGLAWLPADQALADSQGSEPGFDAPGDFDATSLAQAGGVGRRELRHAGLPEAESQAWANAVAMRARVNLAQGRAKCEGLGGVFPGDVVELAGCGSRFNGRALVTGVRHAYDTVEGWKTHLQFGGLLAPEDSPAAQAPRPARGLVAPVSGLQLGVVTSNDDPTGEHRVRVRLPLVDAGDDGVWARVASLDAGAERGFFFRPEIGDEVVIGFIEDDPRHPVLLGMLHSSAKAAPLDGTDDNHLKLYKSRSGMRLQFDDEKTVLTLDTPAGQKLVLDDDAGRITLADQHGNQLVMDASGIVLESASAITLKGASDATLQGGSNLALSAGTQVKLEGSAGAELSSAGITKVTGALVQIN